MKKIIFVSVCKTKADKTGLAKELKICQLRIA